MKRVAFKFILLGSTYKLNPHIEVSLVIVIVQDLLKMLHTAFQHLQNIVLPPTFGEILLYPDDISEDEWCNILYYREVLDTVNCN